jgi:hypothetical protein
MTLRSTGLLLLGLALLGLAACGGDGKKTRESCDVDADCTGGACFEDVCYTACADQSACAADELCVAKDRGDDAVDLCVVAADFAPCTTIDDCRTLVPAACQAATCLEGGTCGYQAAEPGASCDLGDALGECNAEGACEALLDCGDGECGEGESCSTCPADCDACPGCTTVADCVDVVVPACYSSVCGVDGQCGVAVVDDGATCESDGVTGECRQGACVTETPPPCGDGVCAANDDEDCATCAPDCGCPTGQTCSEQGVCTGCEPVCGARECGDDGCGGVCGQCSGAQTCNADGQCEASGVVCGDGSCGAGEDCTNCSLDCPSCVAGYAWIFDDQVTTGFSTDLTADPWQAPIAVEAVEGGPTFLGPFGKQVVKVSLGAEPMTGVLPPLDAIPTTDLPGHDTVRVTFDLLIVNTWHGEGVTTDALDDSAPDSFLVEAPGTNLARSWSFSNCPGTIQSYPDVFGAAQNAPKTGALDTQPLGLGSGAECGDAIYRVSFEFAHTAPSLELRFTGDLTEPAATEGFGTMTLADESWGLDNVKIELLTVGGAAPTL